MEIGVSLPNSGPNASPDNVVRVSQWAEKLGYRSIWATDHVVLPEEVKSHYPYDSNNKWPFPADTRWLDPLLSLAWAGQAAPSLKLGTSILILPLRNPIILAKQLATLDFLTGGRVIFGAGLGWMKEEFQLVGAPFKGRGSRAIEMIELMRELWSGATVNFQGEFWQVRDCQMFPRPAQQPSIPVLWGGHSEFALRRVAQVGDGWHPTQITIKDLEEGLDRLRELCAEYDRDFNALLIVARPHKAYPINPETIEQHRKLGVQHLVLDPPASELTLDAYLEELERVSEVCELRSEG